jgi:hypothetical protein
MRPILRVEIIPPAEYETARAAFRTHIIEEKRRRRVRLGEHMSCVFENRDSVHLQIQEMLRTEAISAESAIEHEIATYNELVPRAGELSLTLFIEITEKDRRDRMLVELAGLEEHVVIEVDGKGFRAAGKREGASPDRTTAVHYLKARLSPEAIAALVGKKAKVAIVIDHPKHPVRAELASVTIEKLAEDLVEN